MAILLRVSVVFGLVLGFANLALGDENKTFENVFEVSGHGEMRDYRSSAHLGFDRKKGEAFVVIQGRDVCNDTNWEVSNPCQPGRIVADHNIPGLMFDKSIGKRGAIVYREGDRTVVCAKAKWLGLHLTGNCRLNLTQNADRHFFSYTLRFLVEAQ